MFYPSLPSKHTNALVKNPCRQKKNQWGVGGAYSELTSRFHCYFIIVVFKRLYTSTFLPTHSVSVVKVALLKKKLNVTFTVLRICSHLRYCIKKAVLKNFGIFTGKHLCWSLFLTNLQALRLRLYYIY